MNSVMMWLRKKRAVFSVLALISIMPLINAGCYGNFPLTKAVYRFNGRAFDDEVATQILFWAFVIFPVYSIASLGDAVVLNLIQYWTGEEVEISQHETEDGTQIVLEPGGADGSAVMSITTPKGEQQKLYFVRSTDKLCKVYNDKNELCGYVMRGEDGTLRLQDADHKDVKVLSGIALAD